MDIKQQLNILKFVEQNPQTSQRNLAKNSGISLGKVNYCLNALIDKGLIKVDNFLNNKNKLQYTYLLTPKGVSEKAQLTQKFLKMRMAEYDMLKTEISQLQQELKI
jgi:EPS-associated MarR family transcriptional regulator